MNPAAASRRWRAPCSACCRKTDGTVVWLARDLGQISESDQRRLRKELQIVFQDPLASLDPRMTIGESIAEPLRTLEPDLSREQVEDAGARDDGAGRPRCRAGSTAIRTNFPAARTSASASRAPWSSSRSCVICDEAVSALDVSIQAQIIDLIVKLQADSGMSLIFISHDLSVVRQISHRVMVLYLGRVVEFADRETIYKDARHPYTKALISAVPIPDPKAERAKKRVRLTGDLPSPLDTRAQLELPQIQADRRSRRRAVPAQTDRSRARPSRRRTRPGLSSLLDAPNLERRCPIR